MKEEKEVQEEFAAWVNRKEKIITFCPVEEYEKVTFQSNEDKLRYVCRLCENGYRIF